MLQTTLREPVQFTGVGLHKGKEVTMILRPAPENTGILFHRITSTGKKTITPCPECVTATGLATILRGKETSIATVEHLLATLRGIELDNVHIDLTADEVPIMDGSASVFMKRLLETGLIKQTAPRRVLRLKTPLTISHGNKWIQAEPHDGFYVDYTIDFPHPSVGVQRKKIHMTRATFAQVAEARTFGFLKDVKMLQANGLALGGSLDNAIVLGDQGVINAEGLRYPDEFVRHKILDFMGDMAVLPLPLFGKFTIHCSGHALNNEFVRTAMARAKMYLEETTPGQGKQSPPFFPAGAKTSLAPAVA